jgi:hypothetical protein
MRRSCHHRRPSPTTVMRAVACARHQAECACLAHPRLRAARDVRVGYSVLCGRSLVLGHPRANRPLRSRPRVEYPRAAVVAGASFARACGGGGTRASGRSCAVLARAPRVGARSGETRGQRACRCADPGKLCSRFTFDAPAERFRQCQRGVALSITPSGACRTPNISMGYRGRVNSLLNLVISKLG